MHVKGFTLAQSLLRLGPGSLACLLLTIGSATRTKAQEIEPFEFLPLPAGTNLAIGYYIYGHNTDFNVARGPTIKGSGVEINIGVARFVHFVDVAGHPAGSVVLQTFGSESAAHIDGQRTGSAFGTQNTSFSAFIWPYVNTGTETNVNLTGSIHPPDGTYDRRSAINVGDNRWRGAVQIGPSQGITSNLAVGYEGFFGGSQQVNGVFGGSKTEEQRIRANAALFVTPRIQTMLELNHDVKAVEGSNRTSGRRSGLPMSSDRA